jgi:hypothetical protein
MQKSQFTDAQIVAILIILLLQQAEKGEQTIAEVCRQHNIAEKTSTAGAAASGAPMPARPPACASWRRRTPGSNAYWPNGTWRSTSSRNCFKKVEAAPDPIKERRVGVSYARERGLSQRRACSLLGLARATARYQAGHEQDGPLTKQLRQIRDAYPRFGVRRAHALLRKAGQDVSHKPINHKPINHKRVQRL